MGGGVCVAVTSRDEQSLASPIIRLKYSSFILPLMCVFIYCFFVPNSLWHWGLQFRYGRDPGILW